MTEREQCANRFDDLPLGIMLRKAEHAHDALIREKMDEIGAPKAFGPILLQLRKHEGMMQSELAKSMNFSAPTICVSVQKLEENGYIVRRSSENDKRQTQLFLTEKGLELTKKMDETFRECENILTEGILPEDIAKMRIILKRLYENTEHHK